MRVELPWCRPRRELLLLGLVAVATLLPVYPIGTQDTSRLCLSHALTQGRLHDDRCFEASLDRSRYGGHLYSDKAPGMSLLALPAAQIVRLEFPADLPLFSLPLWAVRVLTSGVALLVCAFLVGRVAEGLSPGAGAPVLATFALGTIAAPLAATVFGHVAAAALCFGAFLLAWRGRPAVAGVVAGAAVLVEYPAALVAAILAVYVLRRGLRPLLAFAAGTVPALAVLLVYNTLAFGAPWHLSYSYLANGFAGSQSNGLFGIGVPHAFAIWAVLAGGGGLLVVSPVLVAAAAGLVWLGRTHRDEAIVCAAVTAAFLLVNFGYFLPYGGVSPGPRYVVPALPFLALGLAPAFARYPRTTALLAALSVVATSALTLTWAAAFPLSHTVWLEIARLPSQLGSSPFFESLPRSPLGWLGASRGVGAGIVLAAAVAAFAVALGPWVRRPRERVSVRPALLAGAAALALANVSAIGGFPYGHSAEPFVHPDIVTSIDGSAAHAAPGDEVDFTVTVKNPTYDTMEDVLLRLELPPTLKLLGAPYYERGSGCIGKTTLTCNLDFLEARSSTPIRFGVRLRPGVDGQQIVTGIASSEGIPARTDDAFVIRVAEPESR